MTVPRSDSPLRIRAVADDSGGKTDAAIIARSKQEPSAFAELFDRHADCVHRFAARRLGAQLADDLPSETFPIAFEHRDRYDLSRADARPWLLGILTNVTRRHRQSEARRWRAMANADHALETEPMAERVAAQVTARARWRTQEPRPARDVVHALHRCLLGSRVGLREDARVSAAD